MSTSGNFSLIVWLLALHPWIILESAHGESAALTPGIVAGWGLDDVTTPPPYLSQVKTISAGSSHAVALLEDGTVESWGDHQAGRAPAGLTNVVAVAAGSLYTLALRSDGTLTSWGRNSGGILSIPPGLGNVVRIAAGELHCLALRSDGQVIAWGLNGYGEATVPPGATNVIAIDAGFEHSVALRSDGTVIGWGRNDYGQADPPDGLSNVVAIAAGLFHNLAWRSDGKIIGWGDNDSGQATVPPGATDIVGIAAGFDFSVLLRGDGSLIAWGRNTGNVTNIAPGFSGVVAVSAKGGYGLALGGAPPRAPPAIRDLLSTQQVGAGGTAVFTVSANGTPPLFYQWKFNGNELWRANASSLIITNVQSLHSGAYLVVVSNAFGSTNSSPANLIVGPTPAEPPTLRVANTLDTGPGSLRQAILDANQSAKDDAIGFQVLGMITLNSSLPEITGSLRILGPGTNVLTVSGRGRHRVFNIGSGTVSTFSDFTIADGYVTNGDGAGILNRGTVLLTNVSLGRNLVEVGSGGGVFNAGHLSVVNSDIWENVVRGSNNLGGGALFNIGELVVDSTILRGNLADNSKGSGGGVMNQGTLRVSASQILSNTITGASDPNGFQLPGGDGLGGGIATVSGPAEIDNLVLSGNLARGGWGGPSQLSTSGGGTGGKGYGGGIYVGSGEVTVHDCTVSNNHASGGGGGGPEADGGGAQGGGLFVNGGMVALRSSTVAGNQATGSAGNGFRYGGDGGDASGGGLAATGGVLSLENCTFHGNQAIGGNGGDYSPSLPGIPGRPGVGQGGAVFSQAAQLGFRNCTVFGNRVIAGFRISRGPGPLYAHVYFLGASYGGGICSGTNMVGLLNSIIAGNLGTTDGTNVNVTVASDGYGTFSSQGHNLIGDTNGASGFIASDLLNVAAGLGPLQDNGGPTLTHALLPGSPAIESGTGIGAPSYDQRGFPRPSGRAFDIGAVEFRDQAQLLELGNGRTQILFLIEPNQTYPIQATTNFFNWQTIGSVPSGPGGSYVFEDTAHLPLRFYRVLLQP